MFQNSTHMSLGRLKKYLKIKAYGPGSRLKICLNNPRVWTLKMNSKIHASQASFKFLNRKAHSLMTS